MFFFDFFFKRFSIFRKKNKLYIGTAKSWNNIFWKHTLLRNHWKANGIVCYYDMHRYSRMHIPYRCVKLKTINLVPMSENIALWSEKLSLICEILHFEVKNWVRCVKYGTLNSKNGFDVQKKFQCQKKHDFEVRCDIRCQKRKAEVQKNTTSEVSFFGHRTQILHIKVQFSFRCAFSYNPKNIGIRCLEPKEKCEKRKKRKH